jgi:hypothetical protein
MLPKKTLRVLVLLLGIGACLAFYAGHGKAPQPASDCPAGSPKCDENKIQGEMMIWESVSRHLLANT